MTDKSPTTLRTLKDFSDDSSDDMRQAQELIEPLKVIIRERYANIQGFTNLERLVSRSGLDECMDDLSVIRHISAAIGSAHQHHQTNKSTLVHTFEFAHGIISETLRKAEKEVAALKALVER